MGDLSGLAGRLVLGDRLDSEDLSGLEDHLDLAGHSVLASVFLFWEACFWEVPWLRRMAMVTRILITVILTTHILHIIIINLYINKKEGALLLLPCTKLFCQFHNRFVYSPDEIKVMNQITLGLLPWWCHSFNLFSFPVQTIDKRAVSAFFNQVH